MLDSKNWITYALTPGIALSAVIFYNSSLQNRFIYITSQVRALNREARELREKGDTHTDRIASIQAQVRMMIQRAQFVRAAILTLSVGFLSFIATILLLGAAALELGSLDILPYLTFSFGLLAFMVAALLQIRELFVGRRTLIEDTRSSFPRPFDLSERPEDEDQAAGETAERPAALQRVP